MATSDFLYRTIKPYNLCRKFVFVFAGLLPISMTMPETRAPSAFTNREFLFAPRGRQFSNLVPTPSHSLKKILGHSGIAFSKELIDTNFKKLHNPIFANFVFHTP